MDTAIRGQSISLRSAPVVSSVRDSQPPQRDFHQPRNTVPTPARDGSEEEDIDAYPDGGLEALLVLFGCSCAGFAGLVLLNCPGTLQSWLAVQELPDEGIARLGWIFGFYTFMSFFSGIQIGPIFDAYGPRALACMGSILTVATYLILGICQSYWQFFITLGICGGIGSSMLLTCAVSTAQLWFFRHRGIATATALCGGSISGIVFPLVLQKLFLTIGFTWALRAVALMLSPFLIAACVLMRRRRRRCSPRPGDRPFRLPVFEPRVLRAPDLAVISLGVYFLEWGLFIVLAYLPSYALQEGMSFTLSFQLLTYLNCGSLVGRFVAGSLGDLVGRFNTQLGAISLCCLSILGIWMSAGEQTTRLISFAVIFGLACGSNISLTPVCVSQLCSTERYGRTYTAVYTISSIGALTGIPLAGEILERTKGRQYWSLILFSGLSYGVSLLCFAVVRIMKTGCRFLVKF